MEARKSTWNYLGEEKCDGVAVASTVEEDHQLQG